MGKINCLKDYWSTANLMSVILTMKVKGRNSNTTGNGCGKNKDGWRENLPPVLYLVCNKKTGNSAI